MRIANTRIGPLLSDLYYNNVSLLLSMNGANGSTSFVDSSSNPKTVTANGDVQISTAQSKFGGSSARFDGSGVPSDYLSVPSSSAFDFGSGIAFTVEGWFYPQSANLNLGLFSQRISGVYCPFEIMQYGTGFTWLIANASVNSWLSSGAFGSGSLPLNTWTHVALVGNGTTLQLYANGISRFSIAQPAWTSGNWPMYIGQSGDGVKFQGHIDDFRVTKGIARYTSNFTPPTRAFPTQAPSLLPPYKIISRQEADPFYENVSLLLKMDGANGSTTFTDSSPTPKTVTRNGSVIISNARINPGIGTTSAYLDNSGNRRGLEIANVPAAGTGDFTYEAWVYPISLTGTVGLNILFDHRIGTGHTNGMFMYISSSGNIAIYNIPASSNTVALNQWNHVAYVRASGILTYYINGISGGSQEFTRNNIDTSLYIGTPNDTTQYQWTGYLDDVRITQGIARYTSNFTVPNESFPDFGVRTFKMPLSQILAYNISDVEVNPAFNMTSTQVLSINMSDVEVNPAFNMTSTQVLSINMSDIEVNPSFNMTASQIISIIYSVI